MSRNPRTLSFSFHCYSRAVLPSLEEVEDQALGAALAKALGETDFFMRKKIGRMVRGLGAVTVRDLYKRTREIEAAGGVLVENEARRRTSGGLFVMLVKRHKQAVGIAAMGASAPSDGERERKE